MEAGSKSKKTCKKGHSVSRVKADGSPRKSPVCRKKCEEGKVRDKLTGRCRMKKIGGKKSSTRRRRFSPRLPYIPYGGNILQGGNKLINWEHWAVQNSHLVEPGSRLKVITVGDTQYYVNRTHPYVPSPPGANNYQGARFGDRWLIMAYPSKEIVWKNYDEWAD